MTRTHTHKTPVYRALSGQIIRETELAIQFTVHAPLSQANGNTEWFPKSQLSSIHRTYDVVEGTFDILMASEWILGQKNCLMASQTQAAGSPTTHASVYIRTQAKKDYDKMAHNRLPYKDDEKPLISDMDDDIPF